LDIPWILVSRQENYEEFKNHLREALENGAQGFLVGRPLWPEIGQLRNKDLTPDKLAIAKLIATTSRDRLIELVRITDEVAEQQPLD
jgi:tagatose-1,6-bisphosphate aldolase